MRSLAQTARVLAAGFLVAQLAVPASLLADDETPVKGRSALTAPAPYALTAHETRVANPGGTLSADEKVLLALDRFTYGPRPGNLERVKQMGLPAWFHAQLNPSSIDDTALEQRLAEYPAMNLPLDQLFTKFPGVGAVKAAAYGHDGKRADPGDATTQAVFAARVDAYHGKIEVKQSDGGKKGDAKKPAGDDAMGGDGMMAAATGNDEKAAKGEKVSKKSVIASAGALPKPIEEIVAMPPQARFQFLISLPPAQLREAVRSGKNVDGLTDGFTPAQKETMASVQSPESVVEREIILSKLTRDIYSQRQLQEVMVDFWVNHFNVYMRKSKEAPYFITQFEREDIRPFALGHFSDLLLATAQSPAMLDYLDGKRSVGPHSEFATKVLAAQQQKDAAAATGAGSAKGKIKKVKDTGLNENYAREVMELHAVGVDAGYTQKDVTELAKVFTGWTVEKNAATFDPSRHEPGDKVVMGHTFHDTGMSEGTDALKMLAATTQCAHFISGELAVRFMGDKPPAAVVNRMAARFVATNGDIREVLVAMVNSPEFFTEATYGSKVKTPQDFVISAVRATNANVESPQALASTIKDLGMPLYGMQTPQGYSMKNEAWNSTTALVNRMNFSMALATNRVAGIDTSLSGLLGTNSGALTAKEKQDRIEARLLHAPVSASTEQLISAQTNLHPEEQQAELTQVSGVKAGVIKYGKDKKKKGDGSDSSVTMPEEAAALDMQASLTAGLVLGSPEFQRR